jgi:hypothetical protein
LTISAALLYSFTLMLLAISGKTWQLVIALLFFGLFSNLINIAMNTQAVGVESMYGRSIMASFHGLWSLAGFTGALAGTFFVSAGMSPLIHFSIICAVTALLVLTSYKYTLPNDAGNNQSQPLFVKPDRGILILVSCHIYYDV